MPFKIIKDGVQLDYKSFLFPAGEIGVKLNVENHRYHGSVPNIGLAAITGHIQTIPAKSGYQTIVARIQSAHDIVELIMLTDALREFDPAPIRLFMPYCSYSRQDRRCVKGEAFSLRAFADIINGLNFERVKTLDPHSDVVGGVFDRLEIIDQLTVIGKFDAFNARLQPSLPLDRPVFVSPDAGGNKKTIELAKHFGHDFFVRADKTRNLATGQLTGFKVHCEDDQIKNRDVVICDDIADGAGTFIGLSKVLKELGAKKVILFVTHGIFSKGTKILFDGGIDEVFTTNSFRMDLTTDTNLTILDVESVF